MIQFIDYIISQRHPPVNVQRTQRRADKWPARQPQLKRQLLYNVTMKIAINLVLAAGLIACAHPPAGATGSDFPLCMYGAKSTKDLAIIKAAGFNCFQTYIQDPPALAELAAEAGRLDIKMLALPDRVINSSFSIQAKSWPMLAWYLYDEPDVHKVGPAELEKMDSRTKAWSPGQRTAFVVGQGSAAFNFGATADAVMVDWYPVPHLKLESAGHHVALTRSAVKTTDKKRPGKPVWAVLQAFDWREYHQRREKRIGRFPTFPEIRFMTYHSLVRGANGLFYYSFSQSGKPLSAWPDRWFSLKTIAAEINALRPMLEKGAESERPAGLDPRLETRVLSKNGKRRMILLNPSDSGIPLDTGFLKGWRPLFEEKRFLDEVLRGSGKTILPPYRVLVLEK